MKSQKASIKFEYRDSLETVKYEIQTEERNMEEMIESFKVFISKNFAAEHEITVGNAKVKV